MLAGRLADQPGVAGVDVAGRGFLNVTFDAATQGALAGTIVAAGPEYGHSTTFRGQNVNLEFISANPTGPIHLGHARWAAVGDAIGRVLEAGGATVTREFYINDRGAQLDRFGASLRAVANGGPDMDDG